MARINLTIKSAFNFWAFSKAGRALAEFHLNYETVKPYPYGRENERSPLVFGTGVQ